MERNRFDGKVCSGQATQRSCADLVTPKGAYTPTSVNVTVEHARDFVATAGRKAGLSDEDVELFVRGVVEADLRNLPSHGIYRLPFYIRGLVSGALNAMPQIREIRALGATRHVDGDNGLGIVIGQKAMDSAVELAAQHGVGVIGIQNSNHSGVLAIHVLRAARRGMIGYFVSNAPAVMAPWGGVEPLLSNSPFAYAFPTSDDPVVLDMACSAVARGKIRLAAKMQEEIPFGWATGPDGTPTDSPHVALEGLVLPMAAYKGYVLAFANEILAAALTGAVLSMDVPREFLKEDARHLDSWRVGHLAMAINIDAFAGMNAFMETTGQLIKRIRTSRLAPEFENIMLPGEPEETARRERIEKGIPIPATVVDMLREFAEEFELEPLA